tara:strand:- start:197370 stop:198854 length:1485 start_codon:yes stop_codon:yes gene_type:complete
VSFKYLHIVSLLFLSSCTVGPDFLKISTPADTASAFINTLDDSAQTSATMNHWWERLNDPTLNGYIDQLLAQNLSLQQAGERIIQAREQLSSSRGDHLPTLSADGTATRSFAPLLGNRTYTDTYNAGVSTSWSIDLFGKIRRNSESAKASFEATQFDYQALTHSLIAELLNRRVSIAVNQQQLALAQKNAENRQKIYQITKKRYNLGAAGTALSDVYLAEENYSSVQAEVSQFERLLTDDLYSLDILLGKMPGSTVIMQADFPILAPPVDVASCVPADLLDRRPDLQASLLRQKATNANIGVAIADLYPSLTLGGAISFNGNSGQDLFTADQLAGSLLSSLTTRIFEGGKLRSTIRLRESQAREAMAAYTEDVLQAVYEVETNIKADTELSKELSNLQQSATALANAERVADGRYQRGIQTLTGFLDIQQRHYSAEQILLRKQQDKWAARIALYLALGGDWFIAPSNEDANAPISEHNKPQCGASPREASISNG